MFKIDKYEKLLILIFLVTVPLSNPWVRGDGVGYYAYVRSLLIERDLNFEEDWKHGNDSFVMGRLDSNGRVVASEYTQTGHINNHWSVGPSILWAPFLIATHVAVLLCNLLGARIPADGFSLPYLITMALATTFYGFLGICLSYRLAINYFDKRWAFIGTLGIWWASSLPVYMYFNPFWSHAHSAFVVALFLWYWEHTRPKRTFKQWLLLGLISGLLVDVYFVNGVFLGVPFIESICGYVEDLRSRDVAAALHTFGANLLFLATFGIVVLPTLITRKIVFGGMLRFGAYTALPWNWRAPYWHSVLFSSDHGMLSWTPLLGFSLLGLFLPMTKGNQIKAYFVLAVVAFYYVISSYPYWNGLASYGNRFFISVTPIFVFGLALLLDRLGSLFRTFQVAYAVQAFSLSLFALWNLAFIFQWGTHMVPTRGPISWRSMRHQQVYDVPLRITHSLATYFTHRGEMMQRIEQEDIEEQQLGEKKGE